MLVLSRKINQEVIVEVGGVMGKVSVVAMDGDRVKLGFDFPRDVELNRREVYEALKRERGEAA